ncbi:hypothetical protein NEOLEDRAFT_1179906 [Neolentinus lepideus HHB14362 ss-1]|uniref:Uncharacterized protein n=1 Tax=Neolentinus lepideus HHB14362 ss-1 TaxID=1314782 RepID=A0A165RE48_9AGAM|nr:hypothetical protein NEOLEDRAFT_1179906 [Neolentinus lepideus HHB14362 ss-1]
MPVTRRQESQKVGPAPQPTQKRTKRTAEEIAADKEMRELAKQERERVRAEKKAGEEMKKKVREELKKARDEEKAMEKMEKEARKQARADAKKKDEEEKRAQEQERLETEATMLESQRLIAEMEVQVAQADRDQMANRVVAPTAAARPRLLKRTYAVANLQDLANVEARWRSATQSRVRDLQVDDQNYDAGSEERSSEVGEHDEQPLMIQGKKSRKGGAGATPKLTFRDEAEARRQHLELVSGNGEASKEKGSVQSENTAPLTHAGIRVMGQVTADDLDRTPRPRPVGPRPIAPRPIDFLMKDDAKDKLKESRMKWPNRGATSTQYSPLMVVDRAPLQPRFKNTTALDFAISSSTSSTGRQRGNSLSSSDSVDSHDQSEVPMNDDVLGFGNDDHEEWMAAVTSPVKTPVARMQVKKSVGIKDAVTQKPPFDEEVVINDFLVTPQPRKPRKRTTAKMPAGVDDKHKVPVAKAGKTKPAGKAIVKSETEDSITAPHHKSKGVIEISDSDSEPEAGSPVRRHLYEPGSDSEVDVDSSSETCVTTDTAQAEQQPKNRRVKNNEMPNGIATSPFWLRAFIPTLIRYMATQLDPWSADDKKLVPVMQDAYNAIFRSKHGPLLIEAKSAIYKRAIQKLYEWRTHIGNGALQVVENHMNTERRDLSSYSARVAFAREMLTGFKFVFANTKSENQKEWTGLLCSSYIHCCLAYHYHFLKGSMNVSIPQLLNDDNEEKLPIGAIGLAICAVERVLRKWKRRDIGICNRTGNPVILERPKACDNGKGKGKKTRTAEDDDGEGGVKFTAASWGRLTQDWAKCARRVGRRDRDDLEETISSAMVIAAGTGRRVESLDGCGYDSDEDERANLAGPSP